MNTLVPTFYERRKSILSIDFTDRRKAQRRSNAEAASLERRRLTSQIRQHEREMIEVPVLLHIDGKEIPGQTQNISLGGLLILFNNSLEAGTPVTLQFSFGESFCYLSVVGQIVFCSSRKNNGSTQYTIGIKFSGIHNIDQKVLNAAIQILRQNNVTQDKSLLKILVSRDSLAREINGLFPKRLASNLNVNLSVTKEGVIQNTTTFQRRKHLRYNIQLEETILGVTPDGKLNEFPCTVINFSRYGINFTTTMNIGKEIREIRIKLSRLYTIVGFKLLRQESFENEIFTYSGEMSFPEEDGRRTIQSFLKTLDNKKIVERRSRENPQLTENTQFGGKTDRRRSHTIFTDCISFADRLPKWKAKYNYYYQSESIYPGRIIINGRENISLGAKDYLGVAHDPRVKEAAIKALERYGTTAWSRVLNGTPPIYEELEQELARFKGYEAALLFTGGYVANITILKTLLKKGDIVFLDENVHASIFDGCFASGAKIVIFKHNSVEDFEKKIGHNNRYHRNLIVVDGVYSVEGDLACLPQIKKIADEYNVPVMVDDAHGLGIMGSTGSGTPEHFNLKGRVDLEVASFSAALAGIGGVLVCKKEIRDYLLHFSNGILFTTSLPPASVAGTLAALRIIKKDPSLRQKLWSNVNSLKAGLERLEYRIAPSSSAIISIQVGNEETAYYIAHMLEDRGVCVNTFRRPAVNRGDARIRISASAAHSEKDINTVLEAFKEIKPHLPENIFQSLESPF